MNIQDLKESNKAERILWTDIKSKSKILMDVKWHWLKGNKQPYLSVGIKQVRENGSNLIGDYSEQTAAIKRLNGDLYTLVGARLSNLDSGLFCHDLANAEYRYKLTRQHLFNKPRTTEEVKREIEQIKQKCFNARISRKSNYTIEKLFNKFVGHRDTKKDFLPSF